MSLAGVARENQEIFAAGGYRTGSGKSVDLSAALRAAREGTRLYRPDQLAAMISGRPAHVGNAVSRPPRIEVTGESSDGAAGRLARGGQDRVAILNFASARNPGGGYVRGARAQEEDLCRASGLYPCLRTQPEYYQHNRALDSLLYSDHIIYSPAVPFFRDAHRTLVDDPFLAAVITAPAPNRGEALRRDPGAGAEVDAALIRRAALVLAVAQAERHPTLVLGAWGCGVFRNPPTAVAEAFAGWLAGMAFAGAFEHVVFAILDRSRDQSTLGAFRAVFASSV